MFLSPFSFTWPTPSLFLFLQMSCCTTEEVYTLSYSKPKPSPTPQIVFFGWYTRLWLHLMLLSETPDENCYQTGYSFIYRLTVHFSHFFPSHSLSRSGSRALPFSTWWESCLIYTFLFFFHLPLHLYLHLPDNVQHFPLNSYFRSCISVGHNAVMASLKCSQFSGTLWFYFKQMLLFSLFITDQQILDRSLSLTDCPHLIHWAPDSYDLTAPFEKCQ